MFAGFRWHFLLLHGSSVLNITGPRITVKRIEDSLLIPEKCIGSLSSEQKLSGQKSISNSYRHVLVFHCGLCNKLASLCFICVGSSQKLWPWLNASYTCSVTTFTFCVLELKLIAKKNPRRKSYSGAEVTTWISLAFLKESADVWLSQGYNQGRPFYVLTKRYLECPGVVRLRKCCPSNFIREYMGTYVAQFIFQPVKQG